MLQLTLWLRLAATHCRPTPLRLQFCFASKAKSSSRQPISNEGQIIEKVNEEERKEVLKTYLQIIPPHRLQEILQPHKTDLSEYLGKDGPLSESDLEGLHKKLKKSVHMIPIETLGEVVEALGPHESQSGSCRALTRKVYTRIMNTVQRKMNVLSLEQIVNFMYRLVKLNYKEFEFMKEVERVIVEEKIKISYPLIRKILWSYTHLDAGSAVLYSHISKTLKIGQHEFGPLELAESAYMLSKTSENATGGYGVFLIAQKHLLSHLSRLQFPELVKAASFMLSQNIGTNQFQTELEAELYKKYPNRPNLRINDLVQLLKSTSVYYFKYKEKALLNMLQASTRKLAPEANLEQFEDLLWSWGRAGKGDRQLWEVLEAEINGKYKNLLKPRQMAFFYYSLCSTEYSSPETISVLEDKFLEMVAQNPDINEHYLLKFLLGMQKRKSYPEKSFASITKMITERLPKLSVKELITFCKVLNESDLCYENKQQFKDMEASLMALCKSAIGQRVYMFRASELVEVAYLWVKLDVQGQSQANTPSSQFTHWLLDHIGKNLHEIPKHAFIKALFCYTIRDSYKEAMEMIGTMEELMKYGPVSYFFSPLELPLAAYCVFHLVVNSGRKIAVKDKLVRELGEAMDKLNPVILNKFVRNGYEECMRLKAQLYSVQGGQGKGEKGK